MSLHGLKLLAAPVAVCLLVSGCGSANNDSGPYAPVAQMGTDDDHGHGEEHGHSHPETLSDAVAELTKLRDTVRDGFANNDVDSAHEPLHDVGHLLDEIAELAEKEGISGEALKSIEASIETLFDAFGSVDKTLHGGEGSTYDEVSTKIDAAVTAIANAATGGSPDEPAAENPGDADAGTDATSTEASKDAEA